ncbi:CPBP family intramembrane glutamic endopeptidase [Bacillus chungangensis]|uniref:Membrane protease YdiL (CAAX protease family) n=1 Tax=Bacillus chungangensis TaxID=587633 RepID=A0ABT9WN07_9BACI|nr:CPBP family intramembrane glutamic endopeptidase [Bacillus chungangensis]MDQ0174669.1 membrane protease YdiL (CAAX protease family) [Bacillus chungangensis]
MKRKWILLLLAGWITITGGLFLSGQTGTIAEQQFGYNRQLIQGLVATGLVVPLILYLYQHVYRLTGVKPKKPVYSWKSGYHFITGVLLAIVLTSLGFMIATSQGWIIIEQWHTPDHWFAALLINSLIAFLFEALPEELALRGMIYDVLRHRFSTWLAVLFQTLLFVCVPIAMALMSGIVGLTFENVPLAYIILILCFGICLQLLRLWTGSLWTTIGFHIAFLEINRFVIIGSDEEYNPPIVTYHESVLGAGGLITLTMLVIGGIIVSLFILGTKRFIRKRAIMTI